jgi:phage baseplate assembly protein W
VSRDVAYPFGFDAHGRTAAPASTPQHVRELVEQLLWTAPGERVNRPDFGTGVLQLVFAPNSPELAATLQFTVQASLEQTLGDVLRVDALGVEADEASLRIDLTYTLRASGEQITTSLTPGSAG